MNKKIVKYHISPKKMEKISDMWVAIVDESMKNVKSNFIKELNDKIDSHVICKTVHDNGNVTYCMHDDNDFTIDDENEIDSFDYQLLFYSLFDVEYPFRWLVKLWNNIIKMDD